MCHESIDCSFLSWSNCDATGSINGLQMGQMNLTNIKMNAFTISNMNGKGPGCLAQFGNEMNTNACGQWFTLPFLADGYTNSGSETYYRDSCANASPNKFSDSVFGNQALKTDCVHVGSMYCIYVNILYIYI